MRRLIVSYRVFIALLFFISVQAAFSQTTWSRLEESSDWQTCGNCGNSGANGATATYSMVRGITSPTLDGSSTKFSVGGAYAYKNGYWYIKHYNALSHPIASGKYSFYIYVPTAYVNAPQGIEFHVQQSVGGRVYDFAWQAEHPKHQWRTFDYALRQWQNTGVAFDGFSGGKWHHVTIEFHAANGQVVHDALTVDGVRHGLSIRQSAPSTTSGAYISNSFQLDLNSSATDYHVYVDKMSVTFQ